MDNINDDKFEIFKAGTSDGLILDKYENWWFTYNGPFDQNIIVRNKNGKMFGIICKSLENRVIPGPFTNLFTGCVFNPTMTAVSGWIIKIYVASKNNAINIVDSEL